MDDSEDYPIEIYEELFRDDYEWNGIPTLSQQDQIFEVYERYGIVNGHPGSTDDEEIKDQMNAIMNSHMHPDKKYFGLKALDAYTQNNHEHGSAADIRDEIGRNMDRTLGY